ncbi:TPA: hypothetical protein ACG1QI_003920 [Enterobacter kobei]
MSTITKERLEQLANFRGAPVTRQEEQELARIALASLETEASGRNPVLAYADSYRDMANQGVESIPVWSVITDLERNIAPLFTAPPPPLSVPAAMEMDDDFDSAFEHGKAVGWNACRAAMLQGADGTLNNECTIPATQFKPVADLYGLTSPTGGETSFTFDAVEARDFIDGGWSCQEYVELGRYQEALTDHSEDKLAMVDHSGDSNNMVEPVTTAYKLRYAVETIRNSGIEINAEKIFAERDALNYPVIPDGWKLVPIDPTKDMLRAGQSVVGFWLNTVHCYSKMLAAAPAAPQQEAE